MTDPSKYKLNHTMLRIKDPKASLKFYELLGMKQISKTTPEQFVDIYSLAYDSPSARDFNRPLTDRQGVLELRHTHGTEIDPDFKVHSGNSDPRGFGHTCISVDNLQAACERIKEAGYQFQKKLEDGSMKWIAFALDPDGYWVEIIGQKPVSTTTDVRTTDVSTYRFNHSMIRVKDPKRTIDFYTNLLGMTLLQTQEFPDWKFNLYFLGYKDVDGRDDVGPRGDGECLLAHLEGVLELTWNYGTEKEENFKYHSGNVVPFGFGNFRFAVDDLAGAATRLEAGGVSVTKKDSGVVTASDPDGYEIELVQNEALKA